ncbi:hypothetical protein EV426DRAFT_597963 [Tirmania nivea]|nr:hypothetical protein EV426DRAFT_597963 [Tirmania nivea]
MVKKTGSSKRADGENVAPGPPWPTTKASPAEKTEEPNEMEKILEFGKEAVAKEQPSKDAGNPQPKEEKVAPEVGAVEATIIISRTQTAEISATEPGKAEKASIASTPNPEPIPAPDPTSTPFISPLFRGSHITKTTTPPPKGPPPSPEQVQEAVQELASLSEAENELADIFAELFAVNEKVSSAAAANLTASEQLVATADSGKDGNAVAKAPQGDQTPAPEPPYSSPTTTTPTPSAPTPQEPKESAVEQPVREEVPPGDGPEEAVGTGSRPGKEGSV